MELRGRFEAPLIGAAHAPAGIVGDGTLATTETGLRVSAHAEARGWMNGLGCLGAILGFAAVALFAGSLSEAGVPDIVGKVFGGVMFFTFLLGGFALGKKMSRARPIAIELAWDRVRNVHVDAGALVFDSRTRPKGRVWFHPAPEDRASLDPLLREVAGAKK